MCSMLARAARREALAKTWMRSSPSRTRSSKEPRRRSGRGALRVLSTLERRPSTQTRDDSVTQDGTGLSLKSDHPTDDQPEERRRSTAYPFPEIEQKWQRHWAENKTFRTSPGIDRTKPKFYVLDMFPYPSGSGLHVGHPEGYTATDILARYKRAKGFNVLHPMGWDAFGLPAEQYALQTNTHPRETTEKNINRFRQQLQSLGFSYDWDREIATTDPSYYKWTQWIFLKLFEKGLAYQAEVPVNWCPALGTVLANEEVIDGKSERGDHPVVRLPMRQWMLRITEYADRLLADLDDLDWNESIKDMQRNWIGRSEGAEIRFKAEAADDGEALELDVFTTRPDTIFGATYMVLAPEHESLSRLTSPEQRAAVQAYVQRAAQKSDLERSELQKTKSGIFTGSYATNPVSGERVPIWVADYVLGSYGSGAIMAVPAHDARDFEFATQFNLPIRSVVSSTTDDSDPDTLPFTGPNRAPFLLDAIVVSLDLGRCTDSSNSQTGLSINGLKSKEASEVIVKWLQENDCGDKKVNYKLRDWLFARQRYWGEPFPLVYPEGSNEAVAIPEGALPLVLPDTDAFRPSGTPESPLANITDWVNVHDPAVTDRPARRETSTMPQWAGSCWYYLRFIDPANNDALVDPELEKYWMPVDLYVGGTEHAVLHLLYARFWHKVLYDLGVVSTKEPFQRLVSQGMILGEVEYFAYKDQDGRFVQEGTPNATQIKLSESEIVKRGSECLLLSDPTVPVYSRSYKMSKSRGNVINPDDIVYQYGADSLRLYEMFMGPLTDTKIWSTRSVEGVHRFLARVYRIFSSKMTDGDPSTDQLFALHTTIKKVSEDTEGLRFNTAIASMMEFSNAAVKWEKKPRSILEPFVLLLAPYAPHLAEELWQKLGHGDTLTYEPWPEWNPVYLEVKSIDLPVQINGKMRGTINVAKGINKESALSTALQAAFVRSAMEGKDVQRVIFVPDRIINLIVK